MAQHEKLEEELERRLVELESVDVADTSHARLSAATMTIFGVVVVGIVAVAWMGSAL
ncbi:MAG: hypothetical protein ACTHV4_05835 [Canibacter sp.]